MKYISKLKNIIRKNKSHLVVGLDTDINKIPGFCKRNKNPLFAFNKLIIDSTKDIVAGYKINTAFYEAYGKSGFEALENTVKYIPENLIKICDAKRGDIANTSELYARAYFEKLNFDAITLSPYMGYDSISPFLKRKNKFIYLLAVTSNPGSTDFQMLNVGNKYLYEIVISKALKWNINQNIGFVTGANHTKIIKNLTSMKSNIPLLIPGVGAQGNHINELIKSLKNDVYLINASRSIIYPKVLKNNIKAYSTAIRNSAILLNEALRSKKISPFVGVITNKKNTK